MTRILFLIPNLMHGGAEKVLVNLVNNLDQLKYEVTLFSIFDNGVNKQFLKDHVKYKSRFKNVFRGNSQLMKLFTPSFLYRFFIKDDYDLVISFLEGPAARIISGCKQDKCIKVAWIHTEMQDKVVAKAGFRNFEEAKKVYEDFHSIVAVSKNVADAFNDMFSCAVPTTVLYNVNDTEHILEKAKEKNFNFDYSTLPNICSTGKIIKVKGFDRLLDAHKMLLNEGLAHKVWVLGKGAEQKTLELKVRKAGLSDSFSFLGFCENPYGIMSKSDLYVCSSWREGFSTAVTEALILGVPCVSTDVSGAGELLGTENEYGIVTENSTDGLYRGLKQLLEDKTKLQFYKEQAKKRGAHFSTSETVKKVELFIDSVLNE